MMYNNWLCTIVYVPLKSCRWLIFLRVSPQLRLYCVVLGTIHWLDNWETAQSPCSHGDAVAVLFRWPHAPSLTHVAVDSFVQGNSRRIWHYPLTYISMYMGLRPHKSLESDVLFLVTFFHGCDRTGGMGSSDCVITSFDDGLRTSQRDLCGIRAMCCSQSLNHETFPASRSHWRGSSKPGNRTLTSDEGHAGKSTVLL